MLCKTSFITNQWSELRQTEKDLGNLWNDALLDKSLRTWEIGRLTSSEVRCRRCPTLQATWLFPASRSYTTYANREDIARKTPQHRGNSPIGPVLSEGGLRRMVRMVEMCKSNDRNHWNIPLNPALPDPRVTEIRQKRMLNRSPFKSFLFNWQ